jgi:hypothetical protein
MKWIAEQFLLPFMQEGKVKYFWTLRCGSWLAQFENEQAMNTFQLPDFCLHRTVYYFLAPRNSKYELIK